MDAERPLFDTPEMEVRPDPLTPTGAAVLSILIIVNVLLWSYLLLW